MLCLLANLFVCLFVAMVVACRMVLKMKVVVERLMVMVVDDGLVAQMMAKGWKRD